MLIECCKCKRKLYHKCFSDSKTRYARFNKARKVVCLECQGEEMPASFCDKCGKYVEDCRNSEIIFFRGKNLCGACLNDYDDSDLSLQNHIDCGYVVNDRRDLYNVGE